MVSVSFWKAGPRLSVAVISTLLSSVRCGRLLKVSRTEWRRYLEKSVNFSLCYVGLGAKQSYAEAWRAGSAGFVCCAYDVVTDWRLFQDDYLVVFRRILDQRVDSQVLRELALDLYRKELCNELEDEGLERGAIALRFALGVMKCEAEREASWGNVNEMGRALQIVDDVLDFEDDLRRGETNCLTSTRRHEHLNTMVQRFSDDGIAAAFGEGCGVLGLVILRARDKALRMLSESTTVLVTVNSSTIGSHELAQVPKYPTQ